MPNPVQHPGKADSGPSISVVVHSQGRGESLSTCLCSLTRQQFSSYEIIVVADAVAASVVQAAGLNRLVKLVRYDGANFAEARNLGIAAAAGGFVAFIDANAVAEPTWLHHLATAFDLPDVGAVTGVDSASRQPRVWTVDNTGVAQSLPLIRRAARVLEVAEGQCVRMEAANMAFRSDVLKRMGGFDEAFPGAFNEADLSLRMQAAGHKTAVAPLAVVHLAKSPELPKRESGVLDDLGCVGRGAAIFLRKHCPETSLGGAIANLRQAQIRKIWRQRRAGLLRSEEVETLACSLEEGLARGESEGFGRYARFVDASAFLSFASRALGEPRVLAGWVWNRNRILAKATDWSAEGHIVSVFLLSPSFRPHRIRFEAPGVWIHQGGIFGRSVTGRFPVVARSVTWRAQHELRQFLGVRSL